MPFHERVTSYTITQLHNDVVNYDQVVRLTLETGHQVFIGFPDERPQEWLIINGPNTTTYMPRGEFDRVHRLLQTESPLFFTALSFIGLDLVNLTSDTEPPGEGPADDDTLTQLAREARRLMGEAGEASES